MIGRRDAAVFAAVVVILLASSMAQAEPPEWEELSPVQQNAFQIESQHFHKVRPSLLKRFEKEMLPGFPTNSIETYATEITLFRASNHSSDAKISSKDTKALVVRYDYGSGLTFRTTVDVTKSEVVDIKAEANRPTILATPEIVKATKLLRSAGVPVSPETVSAKPINDDATNSMSYGHRLIVLWQEEPVQTNRILVDLTSGKIIDLNY